MTTARSTLLAFCCFGVGRQFRGLRRGWLRSEAAPTTTAEFEGADALPCFGNDVLDDAPGRGTLVVLSSRCVLTLALLAHAPAMPASPHKNLEGGVLGSELVAVSSAHSEIGGKSSVATQDGVCLRVWQAVSSHGRADLLLSWLKAGWGIDLKERRESTWESVRLAALEVEGRDEFRSQSATGILNSEADDGFFVTDARFSPGLSDDDPCPSAFAHQPIGLQGLCERVPQAEQTDSSEDGLKGVPTAPGPTAPGPQTREAASGAGFLVWIPICVLCDIAGAIAFDKPRRVSNVAVRTLAIDSLPVVHLAYRHAGNSVTSVVVPFGARVIRGRSRASRAMRTRAGRNGSVQ